ncbi:MAG: hypothetical protein WAM58_01240 [Candidatus Acidiferrum sp.]
MNALQDFQTVARAGGFVDVEECGDGTVLWFRKEIPDVATKTHQRICMDSSLKSVTLYWMNILGKIDSKTFRTSASLQEWIALHPAT